MTPTDEFGGVRLYHGDAMRVLNALPPESVQAVITDPPYGIAYQSAWRTDKAKRHAKIAGDDLPCVWWLPAAARCLSVGGCLVCFCRWDVAEAFRSAIGWAGLDVVAQLVWDRMVHGMGDLTGEPAPQHDLMWFAVKGRYALPGRRPTSVYREQRLSGDELTHPCEKPVGLMADIASDFAPPDGTVLDPFMGSGTTGIGCMQTGRKFIGCELDPTHYATALRRLRHADGAGSLFDPKQLTLDPTL